MATLIWPGGTQTQDFEIPFAAEEVAKVIVSYEQEDETILEKTITSFEDAGYGKTAFSYELTQAESLLFRSEVKAWIQLNVMNTDGKRIPSVPFAVLCGPQFHREVIT